MLKFDFNTFMNINGENDYIDKIKNGYVFKKIDKQPIIATKNIENSDKSSTEVREADIIFGDDIVEYE